MHRTTMKMVPALLGLSALALTACGESGDAAAEDFPESAVDVTIPFDPGGGSDVMARMVEQYWEDEFGVGMNFEYRSGAGGTVGMMEFASTGSDDGYDLATFNFPHISVHPAGGLADYTADDFEFIGQIASDYNVAVVRDDSEYESMEDFVDAAEGAPGSLSVSIPQAMDTGHIAYAQLLEDTGIDAPLVSYQSGSEQLDGILSGDTDLAMGTMGTMGSAIDSGDLRVLGVTSPDRLEYEPDWPTFLEQGYEVETYLGRLWMVPAGTDEALVQRYQEGFQAIADDPDFQQSMEDLGYEVEFHDGGWVDEQIAQFEEDVDELVEQLESH